MKAKQDFSDARSVLILGENTAESIGKLGRFIRLRILRQGTKMTYEDELDDETGRDCEICGRTLRTGRKYCYEHRSQGRTQGRNKSSYKDAPPSKLGTIFWFYLLFVVLPLFFLFFLGVINEATFGMLVSFYIPIVLIGIYIIVYVIKKIKR